MILLSPLSQSYLTCPAVTVSPEPANSAPRLASGELRVGPRRHQLICDQDGTLRQEFANLCVIPPSLLPSSSFSL